MQFQALLIPLAMLLFGVCSKNAKLHAFWTSKERFKRKKLLFKINGFSIKNCFEPTYFNLEFVIVAFFTVKQGNF